MKQNKIRGCNGAAPGGVDSARKVDVCEIYSPPRITLQARKYGLRPGEAMDLMTGYDFDKEEDRIRAWNIIEKDKPMLLVGSPECRMFSTLQNLNRWTNKKLKEYESAKRHLEFTCKLYDHQISQGRWFLHEHPVGASSWKERCVRGIMKKDKVITIITDQCMFGLKTKAEGKELPQQRSLRCL